MEDKYFLFLITAVPILGGIAYKCCIIWKKKFDDFFDIGENIKAVFYKNLDHKEMKEEEYAANRELLRSFTFYATLGLVVWLIPLWFFAVLLLRLLAEIFWY